MKENLNRSTAENKKIGINEIRKKCFNFLRKLGKRKRGYYINNPIAEEDDDEFLAAEQR